MDEEEKEKHRNRSEEPLRKRQKTVRNVTNNTIVLSGDDTPKTITLNSTGDNLDQATENGGKNGVNDGDDLENAEVVYEDDDVQSQEVDNPIAQDGLNENEHQAEEEDSRGLQ